MERLSSIREQIVKEANSWLGTPYADFQCCKYFGVDCLHLLIGVGRNVGLLPHVVIPYYSPQWHLNTNNEMLLDAVVSYKCAEKTLETLLPGDFILFRFAEDKPFSHVGIYVNNNEFVHSLVNSKSVVRHKFTHAWRNVWGKKFFVYPGVLD